MGSQEDKGNSSALSHVNWAAVLWGQTKQKYPGWYTPRLAVGWDVGWRALGLFFMASLRSLGFFLTVGQLGSKRETLKGEHYKREKEEAASFLNTWTQKSQNIASTTFY